jgi:hypothetical protein
VLRKSPLPSLPDTLPSWFLLFPDSPPSFLRIPPSSLDIHQGFHLFLTG